ncbi:MAG: YkgJ family cysteine cluster protein [Candidatus Schekmanbacteria bacterium]|nr:MAG: YkgJ family cysteine cluster protein [Candidatus Schekmanbacteria bacterium]
MPIVIDKRTNPYNNIQKELSSGLLYTHIRINDNTKKVLESTSFLYALIELLNEKGLLSIEELDERKKQVAERLLKKFVDSGIGLIYQDPEYDKYNFEHEAKVDCKSRLHICKAICCKIPFALSRQDVYEGIIKWDFGRPYLIAHDADGYCVHLDRKTYLCTVHQHRPVPCRGFDCKDNGKWKVWLDYDRHVINPELIEQINDSNDKVYNLKNK